MRPLPVVRSIGYITNRALRESGGTFELIPGFDNAPYVRAAGKINWVGSKQEVMHPRAVVIETARYPLQHGLLEPGNLRAWRPAPIPRGANVGETMLRGCIDLHRDLSRIGKPQGFAVLLAGGTPERPFDQITSHVHNLAKAFREDNPQSAYESALPLLGAGAGFTPSGDDVVVGGIVCSPSHAWIISHRREMGGCGYKAD